MRRPKDITFNCRGVKLTFNAFDYPYDKGADGRIYIDLRECNHEIDETDWDGFGHKVKMTIEQKEIAYGLTYKNLKRLAQWAEKAAEWVKYDYNKKTSCATFKANESVND